MSKLDNTFLIPALDLPQHQSYILHLNSSALGSFMADLVSHNRYEVVQKIEENNNEVISIVVERNKYGLNDYRIICRRRSA